MLMFFHFLFSEVCSLLYKEAYPSLERRCEDQCDIREVSNRSVNVIIKVTVPAQLRERENPWTMVLRTKASMLPDSIQEFRFEKIYSGC